MEYIINIMRTIDIKNNSKPKIKLYLEQACLIARNISFKKLGEYSCYKSVKTINNILLKNSQLLFENNCNHKKKFFELINDASKLCHFPYNIKNLLIKVMPYIIQIYEDELKQAEKEINYIELYTKLDNLNANVEKERTLSTIIFDGVEYVSYSNEKDLLNIHSLKCNLNFINISEFECYWRFIHELFQIIDLKIETQQRKRGLCYYGKNGEPIFETFDEGNTERRTRVVIKRMIKDGYLLNEFNKFEKYRVYKYKIAEKIVTRMLNSYSCMYNAMYGELSDLLDFEKHYSSNNNVCLKEIEEKIINENYYRYISKFTALILSKYLDRVL